MTAELGSWGQLVASPKFRCGHPMTPDNTFLRLMQSKHSGVKKLRACLTCRKLYDADRFKGKMEKVIDDEQDSWPVSVKRVTPESPKSGVDGSHEPK